MQSSIEHIETLTPIKDADKIEKATLRGLGWECVVRKGIYKVGDPCVYIRIDSIIPLSFLSDNTEDNEKRHRLRTVKMKKQMSQGLIIPYEKIPASFFLPKTDGEELTLDDYLSITKYEKAIPASMQGLQKGDFPTNILPKTDEERIQNDPFMIELVWGSDGVYATMKMDGTSCTYFKKDGEFHVCSRNRELKDGDNFYWNLARKYDLENKLPEGYAIQGEGCSPTLQGGKTGVEEPTLFIFNVFDIANGCRKVAYPTNRSFADSIGVPFVPVIEDKLEKLTLPQLLDMADQLKYMHGNNAEGMVIRTWDQKYSFKVISNTYLLKDEE